MPVSMPMCPMLIRAKILVDACVLASVLVPMLGLPRMHARACACTRERVHVVATLPHVRGAVGSGDARVRPGGDPRASSGWAADAGRLPSAGRLKTLGCTR
eukprot:633264-Pleurochrysis_carterae.AAC.1